MIPGDHDSSGTFQSAPSCEGEPQAAMERVIALPVSIRALVRGRTSFVWAGRRFAKFQSAPSCEGEPWRSPPTPRFREFQSAPSCEGERLPPFPSSSPCGFNPRPRARANKSRLCRRGRWLRFNPRPRARANPRKVFPSRPQWCFNPRPRARANRLQEPFPKRLWVSIRALVRGRTADAYSHVNEEVFQSAPSCEGEPAAVWVSCNDSGVSIRALVRGRTETHLVKISQLNVSIRALVRGRTQARVRARITGMFQSAPSCEGEHQHQLQLLVHPGFNPRPRARANPGCLLLWGATRGFQSAHSCEGEPKTPRLTIQSAVFQSAPSCEGELACL